MAHELDFNRQTGRANMFYVGETPWHREGHSIPERTGWDESLNIAGMRYVVGLRKMFVHDGLDMIESPHSRSLVREDRWPEPESILATVGMDYALIQTEESIEVLKPLVDSGVAMLNTGGVLRGGRDAWLLAQFNIKDPVVQECFTDKVVPFGLVHVNHGTRASYLMLTPIRVVCANTLSMAHEARTDQYVKIIHRGGARVRLVEAAERMFGGIVERYRVIANQYTAMKARILSVDEFVASVLDTLAPLPEANDTESKRGFETAMNRAESKRALLTTKWEKGKGHVGDHSAWEAYNGAIECIDHESDEFKVRGSRVESLLTGRLSHQKQKVADAVYALCVDAK